MKTAGQILGDTRKTRQVEIAEVAKTTKIRPQYLAFIESDAYAHLPNSTVTKGFIRNYSEYLGLDPDHVLAIFRRDFVENYKGQIIPRGLSAPLSSKFTWTPRLTLFTALGAILVLFFAYLFYQYRLLSGPPTLVLDQPLNNIVTTDDIVTISGHTNPEATVSINDQKVALSGGGNFTFRWELPQKGIQQITVVAISKAGKTTSITRTVNYQ